MATGAVIYGDVANSASLVESSQAVQGENISVDQDGIWTANYIVQDKYQACLTMGAKAVYHPHLPDLIRTNFGLQRTAGDTARLTIVYKGVPKDTTNIRYSIQCTTQAQPIETHPFFDEGDDIPDGDELGDDVAYGYRFGDPIEAGAGGGQGSKQALFEILGGNRMFKGFPLNSQYNLQGVQQYLDIGVTIRAVIVSHASDGVETTLSSKDIDAGGAIYQVGQVCDPPDSILPDVSLFAQADGLETNYNWLVTSCDTEIIGSALKQNVQFTLSGYLGWNSLLYRHDKDAISEISTTLYTGKVPKS